MIREPPIQGPVRPACRVRKLTELIDTVSMTGSPSTAIPVLSMQDTRLTGFFVMNGGVPQ